MYENKGLKNVILLAMLQGIFVSATIISFTVAGLVGELLSTNKALATLPIATTALGTLILVIPAAHLMKYIGRRKGFILGAFFGIICGVFAIYSIYIHSLFLFCLATCFMGMYQAFSQYYRFAATEVVHKSKIGLAISYVLIGGVAASIIGPMFVTWTHNILLPLHYAGAYIAVIFISMFGVIIANYIDIPLCKIKDRNRSRSMRLIASQPVFLISVFNNAVAFWLMVLVMSATPLTMIARGFDLKAIALVIQAHLLGMYAPSFFSGKLVDRFGAIKLTIVGIFICLASAYIAITGTTILHFLLALFCLGVAWNFIYVSSSALLTESYSYEEQEKTQAINEFIGFLVSAFAAFFAGVFIKHVGWTDLNYFTFPVLLISAGATIWYAWNMQTKIMAKKANNVLQN